MIYITKCVYLIFSNRNAMWMIINDKLYSSNWNLLIVYDLEFIFKKFSLSFKEFNDRFDGQEPSIFGDCPSISSFSLLINLCNEKCPESFFHPETRFPTITGYLWRPLSQLKMLKCPRTRDPQVFRWFQHIQTWR